MGPCNIAILALCAVVLVHPLKADEGKPTRAAFIGEALDAKPTPITPKFNDNTRGSYHVEKGDLIKGLEEEAKKRKLTLRAITIVGPLRGDPLWTSYVVVVLQEGDKLRVNSLVMPHARITAKGTGVLTADEYKKWLDGIHETGALQERPVAGMKEEAPVAGDIVMVTWSADGKTRKVLGGSGQDEKTEKMFERFNGVLKELKKTYPETEK